MFLCSVALCLASVQSQRVIDITNSYTTISDVILATGETLRINYYVDPFSLTFLTSTLHKIPEDLFSRDTLHTFAATYASITDLEDDDFEGAVNLRVLDLQFNLLTELEDHIFSNANNLEELLLTGNQISTVGPMAFEGIPRLRILNLYNNRIQTLPSNVFHPLYSLYELDLGFNQLSTIDFPDFSYQPMFDTLWLEGNQLSNLGEYAIISRHLRNLFMYSNPLATIGNDTFAGLPFLRVLSLHTSGITELEPRAFYGMRDVETLILYSNAINELPSRAFTDLMRLRTLDLGSNGISSMSFGTFAGLESLETLWLDRNNFVYLDAKMLIPMKRLRSLMLSENEIVDVDFTDIGYVLPELNLIGLQRNRFICSPLADMIANLRRFNIMLNAYPNDYGQILLNGVQCTDGPSAQQERLDMNLEGRRQLMSNIAPYSLTAYHDADLKAVV